MLSKQILAAFVSTAQHILKAISRLYFGVGSVTLQIIHPAAQFGSIIIINIIIGSIIINHHRHIIIIIIFIIIGSIIITIIIIVTLAERLRRRPAKPMGSPRVGSNPTGVAFYMFLKTFGRRC